MTPCEKLGYKVGDKFEHHSDHVGFKRGGILTLKEDDGSDNPAFYGEGGCQDGVWAFLSLNYVKPITTTKLRPAKQALADAIHASGKSWPDGANWAAQDKHVPAAEIYRSRAINFYVSKPRKPIAGETCWDYGEGRTNTVGLIRFDKLLPNWHQAVISRDEYFTAHPDTTEQWTGKMTELETELYSQIGELNKNSPLADTFNCKCVARPLSADTDALLTAWQSAQAATREARTALEAAEQTEREAGEAVKAALGKYGWGESVVESVPTHKTEAERGAKVECIKVPTGAQCRVGDNGIITKVENKPCHGGAYVDIGRKDWYGVIGEHWKIVG